MIEHSTSCWHLSLLWSLSVVLDIEKHSRGSCSTTGIVPSCCAGLNLSRTASPPMLRPSATFPPLLLLGNGDWLNVKIILRWLACPQALNSIVDLALHVLHMFSVVDKSHVSWTSRTLPPTSHYILLIQRSIRLSAVLLHNLLACVYACACIR